MTIRALCDRLQPRPAYRSGLPLLVAALMLAGAVEGRSPHTSTTGGGNLSQSATASCDTYLVLSNVNLIDGNGGESRSGVDIVIAGRLIERIVKHGSERHPPGATAIDLDGSYAIPGLIDGHVHLTNRPEIGLELMLRAGITAVRDMGGDGVYLRQLQEAVRSGEVLGPDVYFSALVGGPDLILKDDRAKMSTPMGYELGTAPWMRMVDDSSDVAQVVSDAVACGATGVKIYSHVSADVVRRISSEAHRRGLRVWAHGFVYPARPEDVIAAGVDVISHAAMLLLPADWTPDRGQDFDPDEVRSERVAHALDEMQARGAMLDPTVLITDDRLARDDTDKNLRKRAAIYEVVRLAHARAVPLAAGTDLPPPRSAEEAPALYGEMKTLVDKVGLAPAEAITAATRGNAAALGVERYYGTVEPGKVADIVILEKDPTVDIANIARVRLVVKGGRQVTPRSKGEAR